MSTSADSPQQPSRRNVLRGGLALAALGAVGTGSFASPARAASSVAMPFVPYSGDSFFKSKVLGAPVDATATAAFLAFMKTHAEQRGVLYPKINGIVASSQWGTSFHLGRSTDPIWKITGAGVRPETQIAATTGFHMADSVADRFPTGTQDRQGLVNDPVFGYSVHFGDAVPNRANRTINVVNASVFWHASNGLDKRNPRSDDSRNYCSRGRIPDAMVIRGDLVKAAAVSGTSLGHVMQMFFVETDGAAGFCHPMTGQESRHSGWGPEGVRIAVKPSVDLVARGFTGGALVIARTLQQHGCYLGDNSGASSMLKGEQATSTYSPYAGTNLSSSCLSKLTWADFVVLPKGWQ